MEQFDDPVLNLLTAVDAYGWRVLHRRITDHSVVLELVLKDRPTGPVIKANVGKPIPVGENKRERYKEAEALDRYEAANAKREEPIKVKTPRDYFVWQKCPTCLELFETKRGLAIHRGRLKH